MPHLTVEAEMPATAGSLSLHKSGIILTHKNINKNEKKSFQQSMLLNKSTKQSETPLPSSCQTLKDFQALLYVN